MSAKNGGLPSTGFIVASFVLAALIIISGCISSPPLRNPAPTQATGLIPNTPLPETASVEALPTPTPMPAKSTETISVDVWSNRNEEDPFLPNLGSGFLDSLVLPAIYAELVRREANGQYLPYLAESLPSLQNGLVRFVGNGEDQYMEVEFQLRPGLRWQDGQPLTADDLVFSWNMVMDPAWPGYHFGNAGLAAEIYVGAVEALAPDRVVYRFMNQRQAQEAAQTGGRLGDPALYVDLASQIGPVVVLDYLEVGRNVFPKHLLANIPVEQIATSDCSIWG